MGDHDELRRLLARDGILYATPDQPIRHLSGAAAPWAFYSWGVTLTERGLRRAGEALLERLSKFHATQIAAYGQTAQPLLGACVLLGGGRYSGLSIRKQPKTSVTGRQVDGPLDRSRPVAIVDDSIVSGMSLEASIRALETDGFDVEGVVALVRFPNRGGVPWAWSNGYRVETLFDIWTDLGMAGPPFRPDEGFPAGTRRAGRVPDRLPLATAARWIAQSYLRTGRPPAPPETFDDSYDAPGGVFVSFRRRVDDDRIARDGFWRFGPITTSVGEDLVYATVHTVRMAGGKLDLPTIERCKVGVTTLGPLIASRPADLDFDRYGIVVRDRVSGHKLGGALPNTQVFTAEAGQYWQARVSNARLVPGEEHDLFRHDLTKHLEPGERWLSYGAPDGPELAWRRDPVFGDAVTRVAQEECLAALGVRTGGGPGAAARAETSDALERLDAHAEKAVQAVAVIVYRAGYLGSGLARRDDEGDIGITALVRLAAARAARSVAPDVRRALIDEGRADDLAVSVVAMHDREELGPLAEIARFKVRPGLDALSVTSAGGSKTLLPSVGPYNGWDSDALVAYLGATPAGTSAVGTWSTFRTAAWVRQRRGHSTSVDRVEFGFVARPSEPVDLDAATHLTEAMAEHILGRIGPSGLPTYDLDAIRGGAVAEGTTPRVVHALASLAEAGRLLDRPDMVSAARRGLATCLDHVGAGGVQGELAVPGLRHGSLADCVLLKAGLQDPVLADHRAVQALGRRLLGLLRPDGRVAQRRIRLGDGQDHEYLPAAVLMAIVPFIERSRAPLPHDGLMPQLEWQRDHFRAVHAWSMAGWHPQGWEAVHRLNPDPAIADHVFEIADWAIDRQLTKNGAFLEDLSEKEPSFNTGFIGEGMASAWAVARRVGDEVRAERYEDSWRRAAGFLRTITVHPEDLFASHAGAAAVGGVRLTPSSARLRIDATSHCLHAMAMGVALLEAAATKPASVREGAAAGT